MLTYLLIGLAHTIIASIYIWFTIKGDWVTAMEEMNELYDRTNISLTFFSGSEAYRAVCVGLIFIALVWPIYDLAVGYICLKSR